MEVEVARRKRGESEFIYIGETVVPVVLFGKVGIVAKLLGGSNLGSGWLF
jgi:hypothetical protein